MGNSYLRLRLPVSLLSITVSESARSGFGGLRSDNIYLRVERLRGVKREIGSNDTHSGSGTAPKLLSGTYLSIEYFLISQGFWKEVQVDAGN